MGKLIIEIISNFYSITGNQEIDSALFFTAATISFLIAFNLVGLLFDALGFYDSGIMSDTHWTIRVLVFIALTWLFKKSFEFLNWLFSFSWWVYAIAIVIIIATIIIISFIKHNLTYRKLNTITDPSPEELVIIQKNTTVQDTNPNTHINSKDYCPRCGDLLINRKGPYGYFWGCESFPNCRYSRRFK